MRSHIITAVALVGVVVPATANPTQAQATATPDFVITGTDAWTAAKSRGFTFQPLASGSTQQVTNPRDGVNTGLQTTQTNLPNQMETVTFAQVVGGNASVVRPGTGSRTTTFRFFGNRPLAPGWSVVRVELTGSSYIRDCEAAVGLRDLSFQVKATSSPTATGTAIVRSVTSRGPAGANWASAFDGRKTFVTNGTDAWGTATADGFPPSLRCRRTPRSTCLRQPTGFAPTSSTTTAMPLGGVMLTAVPVGYSRGSWAATC